MPMPKNLPLMYRTPQGVYTMVYHRSPWLPSHYQVCQGSDVAADTLCTVDCFGNLVPTHGRDPASPNGMVFRPLPTGTTGATQQAPQ